MHYYVNYAACNISPLTSTGIELNAWFNLSLKVECLLVNVHWYTSGSLTQIERLLDGKDFVKDSDSECSPDDITNRMIRNHRLSINMTMNVHQLLNGVVTGFSYDDQGRTCVSLPSARYYIMEEPRMQVVHICMQLRRLII